MNEGGEREKMGNNGLRSAVVANVSAAYLLLLCTSEVYCFMYTFLKLDLYKNRILVSKLLRVDQEDPLEGMVRYQ